MDFDQRELTGGRVTTMPKPSNQQLAEAVKRILAEHNLSLRGQRARTGIDHVTMLGMTNGIVPNEGTIIRFARGFGLDINEWLELAGYERLPESGPERLLRGLREIAARRGKSFPFDISLIPQDVTVEKAEEALAFIEEEVRKRHEKGDPC